MPTSDDARQPEPGTDSRVEDWFGQSVEKDTELADEIAEKQGEGAEAEAAFDAAARGRKEQQRRHGDHIDADQGRSAYQQDES